jgi:hypothetical protein
MNIHYKGLSCNCRISWQAFQRKLQTTLSLFKPKENRVMNRLKYVLAGAAALGAVAFASGSASAMPNGLSSDALSSNANVEQVRWVCGPYRCGWRPNYYGWGPRWRYWRRW